MFDRFGVGSPSPFGIRGGVLAIGVHAAILGYGLRATPRHAGPSDPVIVGPLVFPPQPQRPGASGVAPVVAAPGPFEGRVPNTPVITVPIPGGQGEPGPGPAPTEPIGSGSIGDANGIYDSNVVEQPPELLSSPPLRYPEMLRLARVEGTVVVQAVVDTLGHIEKSTLKVVSSPHPALSASAADCLEGAVFRPGRVDGRAVRVLVQVPVRFSIGARRGGF
ncbi:MAG TPA: energy transducer TonB [Gemmatimonadales bacterium]|nr:energy transducer TonB [Gemmatimonadales bacterium]